MSRLRTATTAGGGVLLGAALTLVSIQAWNVSAAPGDTDATYQPLEPCRLLDTRPDSNVGDRKAPLGAGETFTAQVTGTNGECTGVPAGATGVATNVTVVGATAPSFLSVFPADLLEPPKVSNLNYSDSSPPTPNKVDVKLSPDGKIKLFNKFGTAHVIVDIVGVYRPDSLNELDNRLAQLETLIDSHDNRISTINGIAFDLSLLITQLQSDLEDSQPVTYSETNNGQWDITNEWTEVAAVEVAVPTAGRIMVSANGTAFEQTAGQDVQCLINDFPFVGAGSNSDLSMLWEASGPSGGTVGEGDAATIAGTRRITVPPGDRTVRFWCRNRSAGGESQMWDPRITAVFYPVL